MCQNAFSSVACDRYTTPDRTMAKDSIDQPTLFYPDPILFLVPVACRRGPHLFFLLLDSRLDHLLSLAPSRPLLVCYHFQAEPAALRLVLLDSRVRVTSPSTGETQLNWGISDQLRETGSQLRPVAVYFSPQSALLTRLSI